MSDNYEMPGHCWAQKPGSTARCLDEPGHAGKHFNWHTDERWPNRATDKAAAQARD